MPQSTPSQSWTADLDPSERKDYTNDWAAELAAYSDTLYTSTFILPTDAISSGLEIYDQGIVPNSPAVNTAGYVFFQVNAANQGSSMWDNPDGTTFRIRHQIQTMGGRTLEVSIYLTVNQR